jgi:DNA-binding PadR family transcriptional regulator
MNRGPQRQPPLGGRGDRPMRMGPRAQRGGIRAGVLALLFESPVNGYQIMQELERRSRGVWRPSPGAVYPALQQLEDEGLITGESAGGGKTFSITARGRAWVERHPNVTRPWEAMSNAVSDVNHGLFAHLRLIRALIEQVGQGGSSKQAEAADKILWDCRRALLKLLSESES